MRTQATQHWRLRRLAALAALGLLVLSRWAAAGAVLGDWGHFLSYRPRIHLLNPDGKAFTVTIYVRRWPIPQWNAPDFGVRLTNPKGEVVLAELVQLQDAQATLTVPEGPPGTWVLEANAQVGQKRTDSADFWLSTSLERAVVWTGEPTGNAIESRRVVWQASVPRKWWFWVPAGTTLFTCRAQRADRYMSQREDWGFFIVSPRGQRIRALWGQPAVKPIGKDYRQEQVVDVEVEPGAAGRFWSVDVHLGDSHNYSNINLSIDGVPPYLARSPEEWFDPDKAALPEIPLYDETPFMQSARIEPMMKERWPGLLHFSPCPSLGDPDGVEVLGDGRFALWNPEGRELAFRIGTYLPRGGFDNPPSAHVRMTGPGGAAVLDKDLRLTHVHEKDGQPTDRFKTEPGVIQAAVTGSPARWLAFTYPATPLVLIGRDADGWSRFELSAGTVRDWFFYVPKGTRSFEVGVAAKEETDVVNFEVCSPDRTLAVIYDRAGRRTVSVPEGLDGKVWHFRIDVGSATRMITRDEHPRYLDVLLTLDVRGVPGLLAPTWEQWFDPARPVAPWQR